MKKIIHYTFLTTLSIFLLSCKGEGTVESINILPDPTQQQQLWMEQSWSEYIVKLNRSNQSYDLNSLMTQVKPELPIINIKRLGNIELVITLSQKIKYKEIYNKIMPLESVESIQPSFSYSIPKSIIN